MAERDIRARLRSGLVVSGVDENRTKPQHVVKNLFFDCFLNKKNRQSKFMKKNLLPRIPAKAL